MLFVLLVVVPWGVTLYGLSSVSSKGFLNVDLALSVARNELVYTWSCLVMGELRCDTQAALTTTETEIETCIDKAVWR